MTGLKSGSGDDLWGDDADEESPADASEGAGDDAGETEFEDSSDSEVPSNDSGDARSARSTASSSDRPYVVRRAIQDKSVQFEREERLTFFVHDDVAEGERELITDVQSALGRDVPKFDVREAVYRAALRNPDDVLDELLRMGYAMEED